MEGPEAPLLGLLARAWQQANPRRAAGGSHAMAGFQFQLDLALLKVLERRRQADNSGSVASIEQLSDIALEEADEPVVVIQAKLTQTAANLRKGLDDLLSVHEVALREAPGRAEEIRYGLAFRSGDPAAAEKTVDKWVAVEPAIRRPLVEQLTIGKHPDPGGEVESLLADLYSAERPRDLRQQWVGGLLEAAGLPEPKRENMVKLRLEAIWERLESLERMAGRRGGVYVVAPADVPPAALSSGKVLTGQQPTFDALRSGYFADRPEVVAQLRNRFLQWIEERNDSAPQGSVPVFWIAGRSGAGKSVLLIQLLSQLRQEGWDPIFWLTRGKGLLPEAARWAREAWEGTVAPLIGIDDPYGPIGRRGDAWDGFLAELNVQLQEDPGGVPIVVCCGPTEQARRLASDFSGQLDVEPVELMRETEQELEALRAWYRSRTGRRAPDAEPNMLLVQLFFEWGRGQTLQRFADGFEKRILDQGGEEVFELLAEMLALNRLYLGFPPKALPDRLSARQRDDLGQLRREAHLVDDDEGRPGLWLAHPHLSNGIYDAWFPVESAAHRRREHFERAAREWMTHGEGAAERLAPVRAIALGLASRDGATYNRVEPHLVEALPSLYATARQESEAGLSIEELALWIEIRAASGVVLTPDPVAEALPLLTPQATRLPATTLLIEAIVADFERLTPDQRGDLLELVAGLLEEIPDWGDWSRVAVAALPVDEGGRLDGVVSAWLEKHPGAESAGWVLASAIADGGQEVEPLIPRARLFLRGNPGHGSWGRVWTALWDHGEDEDLREIGLAHLEAHPRDPSWSHIWERLSEELLDRTDDALSDEAAAAAKVGTEWLPGHIRHRGWGIVWERLWTRNPGDEQLERMARTLLQQTDPTLPAFSFVWMGLWEAGRRDSRLIEWGTEALRRIGTNHLAWGRIFPALYEAFPNPDLRALGRRWLRTAVPSDPGWGHVLPALWQVGRENGDRKLLDELEPQALRFLREASAGHSGWNYVFLLPWQRNRTDWLRRRGLDWLNEVDPSHPGIGRVWEALWDDADERDHLVDWAGGWFEGRDEHPSWPFVWRRICLEAKLADHLQRGEEWVLRTPMENSGWTYVFRALLPRRQSVEVRRRGFAWLDGVGDGHQVWDLIWRDLWESAAAFEDHDELRERGLRWLGANLEHPQWAEMWLRLWAREESEELRALAVRWLDGPGVDNPRADRVRAWLEGPGEDAAAEPEAWGERIDLLRLRLVSGHSELLPEAVEIASKPPPVDASRNPIAWKNLWLETWNRVKSSDLRSAALTWLDAPSPTRSGRSYVWEALWSSGRSRELYDLGMSYLASAPLDRSRWSPIWLELWDFEPAETLVAPGWAWCRANPKHPNGSRVLRRLEAAPDEMAEKRERRDSNPRPPA